MKRKDTRRAALVIGLLLSMLFTFPVSPSAIAVFGLGTCEKVKKQMNSVENSIKKDLNASKPFAGKQYSGKDGGSAYVWRAQQKIQTNLDQVWKLGTNNPKCFTNTQQLALAKKWSVEFPFGQFNANSYVPITPWRMPAFIVGNITDYISIYNY